MKIIFILFIKIRHNYNALLFLNKFNNYIILYLLDVLCLKIKYIKKDILFY